MWHLQDKGNLTMLLTFNDGGEDDMLCHKVIIQMIFQP
jgi:hypothetical protein